MIAKNNGASSEVALASGFAGAVVGAGLFYGVSESLAVRAGYKGTTSHYYRNTSVNFGDNTKAFYVGLVGKKDIITKGGFSRVHPQVPKLYDLSIFSIEWVNDVAERTIQQVYFRTMMGAFAKEVGNFQGIPNYIGEIPLKNNFGQYRLELPNDIGSNFNGYTKNVKNGLVPVGMGSLNINFSFSKSLELQEEYLNIARSGAVVRDGSFHADNFLKRVRDMKSVNNESLLTVYQTVKVQKHFRYPKLGKLSLRFLKSYK